MSTRRLQRDLYLTQRTLGDIDAARSGRLGRRLAKRWYHRALLRLLRKGGAW